ncbi:MAG: DUF1997 domain-containing protein [Trichodesmium sp. St16_bin4-tuft]|mgnify:FL=1|nr:DUF1997 domain-containing protein [Trichodesmium sp. MAG_R01]MDE5071760.1 DUF1997 domain-containing protein [Trichodesmium sp. St5_bin8]MDE5077662.1 DUF1997 domain-containing protein [Trichodesmium sp. St2_bin6]MDE5092224.1 DUF1997 domain-containing protein [Trichodesmium sp. St18_bin3_1_1]MDE5097501.1 DUF1997 domain-containing protein [Trichodesmium sp. St16_bin4-tuft]MDE5105065.1 DUF1997 domain-containing protein [Trichodesmium sp. St19_bin2]
MICKFTASQSVDIPVVEQKVPIQHYLRQPKRLVNALVDPTRLEQLDQNCFRLKMRPLHFMMLSIQPTVDMRLWSSTKGKIYLKSDRCEIRGVEYINQRFNLNLVGILDTLELKGVTHLKGQADLEVKVELPPPLLLTPLPVLETTGNSLLKSVLMTIKQRLTHQLLLDYYKWANDETQGLIKNKNYPILSPSSQGI